MIILIVIIGITLFIAGMWYVFFDKPRKDHYRDN